ncbi:DoxX family protein [Nocardioides aequoreus]|uniref:DoxX family protein n=1 Tax=Nocardioides aequoreus TaxID=397278 RepID=UPI0004C2D29F|nr:DoxX family protein [Nocardioides aequoreus]
MNVVLWIVAGVLALAMLGAGGMKLARSREQLREAGMGWVDDFSPGAVKAIGTAEVAGALGLVLPPLVDVATWLAPLAAVGLLLTMLGAVVVHLRRGETPMVVPPLVLGVLAAVVAWGRFGPYPFG